MRTIFSKLISAAVLSAIASTGYAQTTIGADCGCVSFATRPEVLLSTKCVVDAKGYSVVSKNTVLYCDTMYVLDKKIYVDSLVTLTIKPGTVIKGQSAENPIDATALIIQRGAKIYAAGTAASPIIFTSYNDDLSGTLGYDKRGLWGGVVILGCATNNLKIGKNLFIASENPVKHFCVKDGQGFIEGFNSNNGRDLYGGSDDNDNSGVLRYVSIRHSGAILAPSNELNGLSLGSVGRGTTIDHIEIIGSDDDGIEFFGGTVNVSYVACMFGNDDIFDYDLGYRGKMQFLFGLDAPDAVANMNDNGFEADNDDNTSQYQPFSNPIICNATIIGNNTNVLVNDQSGSAAFMAKEYTFGEVYNSIFANYVYGLALSNKRTGADAYKNWTDGSFKFENNTFVGVQKGLVIAATNLASEVKVGASATDSTLFYSTKGNSKVASVSGFDFAYVAGTSDKLDVTPSTGLTPVSTRCPYQVSFRGAFDPSKQPWLSESSFAVLMNVSTGLVDCPTDTNADGKTNNDDFLNVLGQFNKSCN